MGWSQLEKTDRSGVRLFRGALQRENVFLPLTQPVAYGCCGLGLEGIVPHCVGGPLWFLVLLVHIRTGLGPAIGSHAGERCWPLLASVWRAIAPLMKPWCAEGRSANGLRT